MKKGLTLMEMIVVVAILGGLSVAVSRIFFANLQGTERAQTLLELRQAGDSTMLNITKRLRNARRLTSACDGTPSLAVSFASRDPNVAVSSGATQPTTISCIGDAGIDYIALSVDGVESYITSSNTTVTGCEFLCRDVPGSPPRIDIEYTLQDISSGETVDFNSTVTLRNY